MGLFLLIQSERYAIRNDMRLHPPPPQVCDLRDQQAEADWVVGRIQRLQREEGYRLCDIAVLFRRSIMVRYTLGAKTSRCKTQFCVWEGRLAYEKPLWCAS
jgi:superfamily I DNA/RNA helicase